MPLTFPSHLAPVLPLKLWRPHWFDGVALCTGAVAPDVAYLASGTRFELGAQVHTLGGALWWGLPVALAYAWLVRRVVAGIAGHLPGGRLFGWPGYAVLGGVRHPWQVTVCSALIGAVSHVVLDRVTHSTRWAYALGVEPVTFAGLGWPLVSNLISSLVCGAVVCALAVRAARRGQLLPGVPPPAPPVRPVVFRTVALAVVALGVPVLPVLPAATAPAPSGVRLLHLLALGAILGGWAATRLPAGGPATPPAPRLDAEQRQPG
ncbi:DUF4184 family protein [Micromonospora sp. HUAS LYJ1]|uniref:DUF4184 family protein n=1 Tax=Micromonospora sp. HUAS LYJ1 TaxID=3061626 RepID=UPI002671AA6D|nr:DUF4184 family protein [Micromonospora sp. HUAS LYJ1]WKU07322.1 DUF4184 family protein [Micromonospora sp. HUAS LYJ1]